MPRCAYPSCYAQQEYTPVLEIPTIRTIGEGDQLVPYDPKKPTLLLCPGVCLAHKESYSLFDWIPIRDWKAMEEAAQVKAKEHGFKLEWQKSVTVTFRPVGWHPKRHLELER